MGRRKHTDATHRGRGSTEPGSSPKRCGGCSSDGWWWVSAQRWERGVRDWGSARCAQSSLFTPTLFSGPRLTRGSGPQ
ncbi:hypothetical protein V5799_000552 [Amblyomma americanum]|uniref:Uncharacterized protein n=1 Tax=Amblyomma americanum TaxID=6943 RepID=A0AAQ4D2Q7_AMBAM